MMVLGGEGGGNAGGGGNSSGGGGSSGSSSSASSAGSGGNSSSSGSSGSQGGGTGGSGGGALGGGGSPANWRDSLPDDIKAHGTILSFQDVPSLVKSYIHAQSVIGKKGAIAPTDWSKSTPEERQAFFKASGLPERDKYEMKADGVTLSAEQSKLFGDKFHELGILPHQAAELLKFNASLQSEGTKATKEASDRATKEGMQALRDEWGTAYAANINRGNLLLKDFAPPEFVKHLIDSGLSEDPMIIKGIVALSKKFLSEDKLREGGISEQSFSVDEIDAKVSDLRARADQNGFYDKNHPAHSATLRQYESLMRQRTGGR